MFSEYDDVVEIEDLMEILNIGRNKAYILLQNGEIKSFKIGRVYKIPKICIKEYIINQIKKK
ncbi:helix-turn-helix domain-containing protein [Mesobacillus jeotgali]|uniref:Helix-turn-helix domain-containing protein n=1 Tax=Mesobacillus jeotgali TaxID=129985 RepID=A0ABY9VBQ3_9BACI|nr:helix-turn-helix domain-containing protein [Mesobacillus jeotgali]WNF21328.1 helix-turn-helix domain-containing protein [Mesobacillus jeotgali]